jgi:hypothetical protein
MNLRSLSALLLLTCATLVLGTERPAQAGLALGADINASKLIGDGSDNFNVGYGFNARAGLALPVPLLTLEAGALFRYDHWTLSDSTVDGSLKAYDILFGGRLGVGALLKPWVGFYIGYGHLSADLAGTSHSDSGLALLIGGGLDVSLWILAVGVHLDWNRDSIDTGAGSQIATDWISVGAHATLSF